MSGSPAQSRHHAGSQLKRGSQLPYRLLAGVEPCRGGWLVVSGKLQGVSLFPDPPQVASTLLEVLDSRPPYEVIALHCPIGLASGPVAGGRTCDREARRLLGPRRGAAVISAPHRKALDTAEGVSAVAHSLLPRIREAHLDVFSYHQRTVFEVHPELGFFQLNGDEALHHPKRTQLGMKERLTLLEDRMPGLNRVLDHLPEAIAMPRLLDACVDLWTARRIAARAIARLPEVPEWNEDGLRMELVR